MQQADAFAFHALIRTKLRPPPVRQGWVARPRLQEQVAQGLCGPLTLVTAPAGYGKSSLLAASLAACGLPAAWLSLDRDDNQPGRFLRYLVAALHAADPTVGGEAAHLAAAQPALPEAILTSLVNDLDAAGRDLVLVLDDYQFLHSQDAHTAVAFLLEHGPRTLHLVLSTRSDPPLPIARLRARAQVIELRAADLRFTTAEAAQFLNGVMGLRLEKRSIAALEERTEGWIAGLQMAALSMRNRDDVQSFVEGFSGTNRFVLDYLLEEVLASQPTEVQRFLLATSVLKRLTAPLCAAVLEGLPARGPNMEPLTVHAAADALAYLEQANLFLVPLDDERRWHRYHHLFAELLQAQLARSPLGASVARLHACASAWFEANGIMGEAIHHALAAQEPERAAQLIEAAAEGAWLNGDYTGISAWVDALPQAVLAAHPWLCIWNAWAYTQLGMPQAIMQWVEAAEQAVVPAQPDAEALAGELATLRAFALSFTRDYGQAIALAEGVLQRPPLSQQKAAAFIRCNLLHLLGTMYFATGHFGPCEETCRKTIALAQQTGLTLRHLHAANKLALVYQTTGRLARADQVVAETWSLLREQNLGSYFAAVQLHFREIDLLYARNDLDAAQRLLDVVLEEKRTVEVPYLQVDLANVRALLHMARGEFAAAQKALDRAAALARRTYIWEGLVWRTEALQMRLWLQAGQEARAAAWLSEQAQTQDGALPVANALHTLAFAQLLLAQGNSQAALPLLERLAQAAEAGGWMAVRLEAGVLQALAWQNAGDGPRAANALAATLALAAPEGHVRLFLDAGAPMRRLLAHWLAHARPGPLHRYAALLLAHFAAGAGSASAPGAPAAMDAPTGGLLEPLSAREREVLQLLALGESNEAIARRLIIAPGTVKAHTAAIYRKLDVANRTEAVHCARRLGLLA